MDFTLEKYGQILHAGLSAGYRFLSFRKWEENEQQENGRQTSPSILLRHDVDRRPGHALAMARLEAARQVRSTYFFRILPCAFDPQIVAEIRDLGHEIGYHYEDWHLAQGDRDVAIDLFRTHLARLREIAAVSSIAMHGSPLAKENNMTIWEHHDFSEHGVIDAILSFDYSDFSFFTDSGRTFGPSKANLRDYVSGAVQHEGVNSSDDLIVFLKETRASRIHLNVHPERWSETLTSWSQQLLIDQAANAAKRAIVFARNTARTSR